MRILTFTTLYPSSQRERHGVFIQNRLLELLKSGGIQANVLAPVPWFPFKAKLFGKWSGYSQVPHGETLKGMHVMHPRYLVIPKIGMSLTPVFLAISIIIQIYKLKRAGVQFDVIDAHYYFPDGVAAVIAGKCFGVPTVVSARGSDINLFPKFLLPRIMIRWAIQNASMNVGVSKALSARLLKLGANPKKVVVARNGVDLSFFRPIHPNKFRSKLFPHNSFAVLSVGNLVLGKGHDLVIKAVAMCPSMSLVIVGRGEEYSNLSSLITSLNVVSRVKIIDELPITKLPEIYSSADALVLASVSEGMPNVLLESMACGTPVVATPVGGVPEIVAFPAGIVVARDSRAIADALIGLESELPAPCIVRNHAEQFSWDSTVKTLRDVLAQVVGHDFSKF